MWLGDTSEKSNNEENMVEKENENENYINEDEEVQKQTHEVITVEVTPEIIDNNGFIHIEGETNLPDYAELMISVNQNNYHAQSKDVVIDGKFKTEEFNDSGVPLTPGKYELSITLPVASVQDNQFLAKAGNNYENLKGDLMKESDMGEIMKYETIFSVDEKAKDNSNDLSDNPKVPSDDINDYNDEGEYVPKNGPSDNPEDYNFNGEYKPVDEMTQDEIEEEDRKSVV